jgi:hypothetical protein
MVEQARVVVLKTVASATKTTQVPTLPMGVVIPEYPAAPEADASISGFRSAMDFTASPSLMDVTAPVHEPRLQKARSSALRLNSVLHHRPASDSSAGTTNNSLFGMRKTRSVLWTTPHAPPKLGTALALSPRKDVHIRAMNVAKLKSFKSFGRAHAGDFANTGPRNATFAEFDDSATPIWGRDGRVAHHPRPRNQAGVDGDFGHTNVAANNATFDLSTIRV